MLISKHALTWHENWDAPKVSSVDADTALKRKARTSGIVCLGTGKLQNIAAVPLSSGSCVSFATVLTFCEMLNCCQVYYFSFRNTRLEKKKKKNRCAGWAWLMLTGKWSGAENGQECKGEEVAWNGAQLFWNRLPANGDCSPWSNCPGRSQTEGAVLTHFTAPG